jgi:DNA (cytosine-5)-methyltransferase 1
MIAQPVYTQFSDYVSTPTGLILPEDVAERRYKSRIPTGIDLFAGCGGFSLGFKKAGFEILAAAEWNCDAAVTYMVNLCRYGEFKIHFVEDSDGERLEKHLSKEFKKKGGLHLGGAFAAGTGWISHQPRHVPGTSHFFLGDIRKLTAERVLTALGKKKGDVDVVTGGPPCQGFSTAGKQNVMDPRNSLVFDFARLVVGIHPKTFVFENVPGIVNMVTPEGIPVLDAIGRIFQDGDFMTTDALNKMVAAQTGAVFGLKAGKKPERERKAEASPSGAQTDLFAPAGEEVDYDAEWDGGEAS